MDGLTQLLVLAAIMFISTFLLGSLPLTLSASLSPRRSYQLSIFSVGLLIGAALTIVIPEGVDTIYNSLDTSSTSLDTSSVPSPQKKSSSDNHSTIGLTLMSGFMLMFLIDQLAKFSTRRNPTKPASKISQSRGKLLSSQTVSLLSESSHENGLEEQIGDLEDPLSGNLRSSKVLPLTSQEIRANTKSHAFSTILGLLTHSVADGIALGASSIHTSRLESKHSDKKITLNLIIFLALMVHKAPAAFGLVSVLLSEQLPKSFVRKALLAFSVAAPLGSLLTWAILAIIHPVQSGNNPNDKPSDEHSFNWWIGVTLLFSGGTFLFVATHALESTTSRPVDLCFPQILPPIEHPQSSTCATPGDQQHSITHQETSEESHAQIELDPASQVVIDPLLTSALMACGMIFPWSLTKIVGAHH